MRHDWVCQFGSILLVTAFVTVAHGQQSVQENEERRAERLSQLLYSVASGKDFDGDATDLIPDLIRIVEQSQFSRCDLAILALGKMKSKADRAVAALCAKLDDSSHATRGHAVTALVAIGEGSVEPLKTHLRSPSGRVRAASVAALGRLKRIDVAELNGFETDLDPRVRAAVVLALSNAGSIGVVPLTAYLSDVESAIAVEAARGLQFNHSDAAVAIPRLIEALSRPDVGPAAGRALGAYGVEARRAVPALIKVFPLGVDDDSSWYEDVVHKALKHIGPPDERDLAILGEYLALEDPEIQILAAESLSHLGTSARTVAPDVELAVEITFERSLKRAKESESKPDDINDNSGRVYVAIETLVSTVWDVTHDADRFLKVLEKMGGRDCVFRFDESTPWDGFTEDNCPAVEKLLRSSNRNVQLNAIYGVPHFGPKAAALKTVLVELAESDDHELSKLALMALAAIGPPVADAAAPILLSKYQGGTVPLDQFAAAIGSLKFRSRETDGILERGLQEGDRRNAIACANVLCKISSDPARAAALVIQSIAEWQLTDRDAIQALGQFGPAETSILPYLIEQLSSDDLWTRHDAAAAIGAIGPKAEQAIPSLRQTLQDESVTVQIQAAVAFLQVTGDASHLVMRLKSLFANKDRHKEIQARYGAMQSVARLGPAGEPFIPSILEELRDPQGLESAAIKALEGIGTPKAVSELDQIAKSSDWVLRSGATEALRKIKNPGKSEGK